MPYKSDAQRRWAHTTKGEKALGGPEGVNEWDQASKGKKLPEHVKKMSDGGIVQDWKQHLKQYMEQNFSQPVHDMGSNLEGFSNLMKQQHPEASTDTVKGYAYGGAIPEPEPTPLPPQFNPNVGMPPVPPPQMPVQQPQRPVLAPNPVNQYLDTQKAQLNKYGPEQQLALSQHLINQRQSLPQKGSVALGGIADALTRVGGGTSNYGGQIQEQQNRLAGEQVGALEKAGTQNIARTEANQRLDAMDPRSELSKVAQQTWGPLLAQNGFKPEQIANMPASSIAALTGQSVEALKAKAEAEMARATLGLKTQEAAQTAKHQTAQEDIATEESKRQMLKETASHPFLHPINAFKASAELGQSALNPQEPEHQTAVEWAQANPTDPRAKRILNLHGL